MLGFAKPSWTKPLDRLSWPSRRAWRGSSLHSALAFCCDSFLETRRPQIPAMVEAFSAPDAKRIRDRQASASDAIDTHVPYPPPITAFSMPAGH